MPEGIKFGDVFEFNGKEYIYLASKEDTYYCARIFPLEESKEYHTQLERLIRRADTTVLVNPAYCYVILTTDDFVNRMAHMANPGIDAFTLSINPLKITVNGVDLKAIKKEILEHESIPKGLKELVEQIEL